MDRRYLIAGLFFSAAAIIAVVLAYPKYQVMKISSQLVTEKQNELSAQNVLVQEISKLRSQQKQMTEEIARVSDLLPPFTEKSIPDLFVELEAMAAESGLSLHTVSFSAQKAPAKTADGKTAAAAASYKTIIAQMKTEGDYRNFKIFAKTIETSGHLMDITFVSITAPASAQGPKKGEAAATESVSQNYPMYSATIRAYYQ